MIKIKHVFLYILLLAVPAVAATVSTPAKKPAQSAATQAKAPAKPAPKKPDYVETTPLEIVANPSRFLNKHFVMVGKFDKFTTLGLDYKKAMRDSNNYVGFMVQRDDVKDHKVPLSELKLFLKREYAEKLIDLNTGDKIKIKGKVFSNALGDGWADVELVEVIEKTKETQDIE